MTDFDPRDHVLIDKTWIYPDHGRIDDEILQIYDEFLSAVRQHDKKQIIKLFKKHFKMSDKEFPLTKKKLYKFLTKEYIEKKESGDVLNRVIFLISNIGFLLHTAFPASFHAKDMSVPDEFREERDRIIKDFKDGKISDIETEANLKALGKRLYDYLLKKGVSVTAIAESGTKGGAGDFVQFFLSTGLHLDENGKLLNVGSNGFVEGQSMVDYATLTPKGYLAQYAKTKTTAEPGEVIALLNRLTANIKLSKTENCKSKKFLSVYVRDKNVLSSLKNKVTKSGKVIKADDEHLIGTSVDIRSAFYCNADDGVCKTCLAPNEIDFFDYTAGTNLGAISVSTVSIPLAELALKKSHASSGLNLDKTNIARDSGVQCDFLTIEAHKVIAKTECKVVIDKNVFKSIEETATTFIVPVVEVIKGDKIVTIDTGYDLSVVKTRMDGNKVIELYYKKGDVVIDTKYKSTETNIQKLKGLLNHRLRYYKTPESVLMALNGIWQTLIPMSWWKSEVMMLNTYIEFLEEKKVWKRTQFVNQDYSDKTKVDIVTSVKRLNHALADNAGYLRQGLVQTIGLRYDDKDKSDIQKVMFAEFDDDKR